LKVTAKLLEGVFKTGRRVAKSGSWPIRSYCVSEKFHLDKLLRVSEAIP
jgi:hypothetical protein